MDFCFECNFEDVVLYTGLVGYLIIYTILFFVVYQRQHLKQRLLSIFLLTSVFICIEMTQFPLRQNHHSFTLNYNLELFRFMREIQIYESTRVLKLSVLNVLLFIPLGSLMFLSNGKKRLLKSVVSGFLLSFSLETMQLLSGYFLGTYRIFDVDDLFLNTIGTLLGCLLVAFVKFENHQHKTKLWLWPSYFIGFGFISSVIYVCSHIIY